MVYMCLLSHCVNFGPSRYLHIPHRPCIMCSPIMITGNISDHPVIWYIYSTHIYIWYVLSLWAPTHFLACLELYVHIYHHLSLLLHLYILKLLYIYWLMYISDTYHLFHLSTTKPSGPDCPVRSASADLSIIQESQCWLASAGLSIM